MPYISNIQPYNHICIIQYNLLHNPIEEQAWFSITIEALLNLPNCFI